VVAETERNACVSILFLINAAMFALCQLIPHAIAQLIDSRPYSPSSASTTWIALVRQSGDAGGKAEEVFPEAKAPDMLHCI